MNVVCVSSIVIFDKYKKSRSMCHQEILSPILVKAMRVNANNYILTDTIVYGSGSIVSSNVIMDWRSSMLLPIVNATRTHSALASHYVSSREYAHRCVYFKN